MKSTPFIVFMMLVGIFVTSCTVGFEPCKKNPKLPKNHQCDRFLL